MTTEHCPHPDPATHARATRWVLAFLGIASVGVGAVGVFVPGLPTTIFLIAACWCFARSCPWLERKLVRNRLFEPFVRVMDSGEGMPTRARVITIAIMWTAIGISSFTLFKAGATPFVPAGIIAAGVIGTVCIWRYGRRRRVTEATPAH